MTTKTPSAPTKYQDLSELLQRFVTEVKHVLGDDFVGAYLQGSFALGDADMQSDCDFIVVVQNALTRGQESGLRALHAEIREWPNHWAGHLEGSYAPKEEFRSLASLGKKWLFIDQGHSGSDMEWSTHCNTEVVRWIFREHGVILDGPAPKELVDEVTPADLRSRLRTEIASFLPDMLSWIGLDSPWAQRYAVTTLCRILYTLDTGEVASKKGSLMWAKNNLESKWQPIIERALAGRSLGWNHTDPIESGSIETIEKFYDYAKQEAELPGLQNDYTPGQLRDGASKRP